MPVVKVGRIAGQYAKPRIVGRSTRWACRPTAATSSTRWPPRPAARVPDPSRMVRAYANASRGDEPGARASPAPAWPTWRWCTTGTRSSCAPRRPGERYERVAARDRPGDAVHGRLRGRRRTPCTSVEIYASHEALLLDYERAMLRLDTRTTGRGSTTCPAHFLWIGERTRQLDGAHIAFAELLANPIGLKIGPTHDAGAGRRVRRTARPAQPAGPAHADHPDGQRQGARRAAADHREGRRRPGTRSSGSATRCTATPTSRTTGYKTRHFDRIVDEVQGFFEVHARAGHATRAASTSSSPARTSPSASAAPRTSRTPTWPAATRRPATRA